MCVSIDKTQFVADGNGFEGCACSTIVDGNERSDTVIGYEERDGGEKLVFFGSNEEAIAKLAIGEDGEWHSLAGPVVMYLPDGTRKLYHPQWPTATL